jgi:hypothetical protein
MSGMPDWRRDEIRAVESPIAYLGNERGMRLFSGPSGSLGTSSSNGNWTPNGIAVLGEPMTRLQPVELWWVQGDSNPRPAD